MEKEPIFYPDFDHPASQLSAFSLCIDVFIISLKNGDIVKFKPTEVAHFKEWLNRLNFKDIEVDDGIPPGSEMRNLSKPRTDFLTLNERKNEQGTNN